MTTQDFVTTRLDWPEGPLVERKSEGDHKDWAKTLVAFANSTPENEKAILYIGASDQLPHKGISTEKAVDEIQRKIADVAAAKCYPPIKIEIAHIVIKHMEKDCHIIAVVVPASPERPHFAGAAYVRNGSKSSAASPEIYRDLIAANNTTAGRLLGWKGQQIQWKLIGSNKMHYLGNATVRDVSGVSAMIQDDNTGYGWPIPLSDISFLDRAALRPIIEVKYWASDRELMEYMLDRWSFFVSTNNKQYHPQYDYLVRQIDLHPELFDPVARSMVESNRFSNVITALYADLQVRLDRGSNFSVRAGKHLTELLSKIAIPILICSLSTSIATILAIVDA